MMLNSTEVNLDDILNMLSFLHAKQPIGKEACKDALALVMDENSPFELDNLYEQVVERAEVLEGVV